MNKNIVTGKMDDQFEYPNVPVGAIIKGSRRFGDRIAYLYRDYEITFEELYCESIRFANALRDIGVTEGDVVATHLPTCPQFISAYCGIVLSGATFTPINPNLPINDLIYQLNDSNTKTVLTYETTASSIQKVIQQTGLKSVIITGDQELYSNENPINASIYGNNWYSFASLKANSTEEEFTDDIDPKNDLVHLAYTGGTTGRPKGVMITHLNVIANVLQTGARLAGINPVIEENGALTVQTRAPTIGLSPSPLFHAAGVIGRVNSALLSGNTTVLFDQFDPTQFLELIEKHKVTSVGGAPAMWNTIVHHPELEKYDLSSVTAINSATAPMSEEEAKLLMKALSNAFYSEGYGLTEATAAIAISAANASGQHKVGTVGTLLPDTEVKLISIDGSSEDPVAIGETGEVCVRGPQVMMGYYNNPEETAKTLVNGWLKTGDIGVFDEDGLLAIVDRKKDMLIYKGFNVYPGKMENILFAHPSVESVSVIGKPTKDAGEIPKAFVVLKSGAKVSEEALMDFVNSQVIHYEKVRELDIIDELPLTPMGKVSKLKLLEREIEE